MANEPVRTSEIFRSQLPGGIKKLATHLGIKGLHLHSTVRSLCDLEHVINFFLNLNLHSREKGDISLSEN